MRRKLVGRQAKESPRLSVKFRPDLDTRHHNGFVFVPQPLGPLLKRLLPSVVPRCAQGQDSAGWTAVTEGLPNYGT